MLPETLHYFEGEAPTAMAILEAGFDDVMAVMSLQEKYRQDIGLQMGWNA